MGHWTACLTLFCVFHVGIHVFAADQTVAAERNAIASIAATAASSDRAAIAGNDGWIYFVPELRAISVGKFWGPEAAAVSRATKRENADPLEGILDFHDQLKRAGIELLLVPVPPKVAIYPDPLLPDAKKDSGEPERLDVEHLRFYELLRERGVEVIDLVPLFLKERDSQQSPTFCKTDSHWSGRGVTLAAGAIANRIQQSSWFADLPREKFDAEARRITISGDLSKMIDADKPAAETLSLTVCGRRQGNRLVPIEPSRDSPVLLMGDSHTLVFHDPTLYASGAGLPDHLAQRLGFAVDLIGVRGSGSTTTRIELLRRKDNLNGKKLVIWCFSFREFTESDSGWRKVPVIRQP